MNEITLKVYNIKNLDCAHCASKIEAAINFVNTNPKRKTIITSLEKVYEALEEKAGTIISKQNVCMYV